MSPDSAQEELAQKHRKDKKDLQAKIQALKKTSSKGDKKKKKEVAEEIARMEEELERRHQSELEKICGDLAATTLVVDDSTTSSSAAAAACVEEKAEKEEEEETDERVSKAQKRRDKKAQKEKERLAEIELQDEANQTGTRQVEQDRIKALLESRNLRLHEVPSDGDCLYAGVAHQLSVTSSAHRGGSDASVASLREAAARVIEERSDEFLPFLSDPKTGEMLDEQAFRRYVNDVAHTKTWGGQVELKALSHYLGCQIEVIQAEGMPMVIGEEEVGTRLVLCYYRHMYGLGEHYNSTIKKA